MPKILLIEDDQTLAESLIEFLELNAFSVTWFRDEQDLAYCSLHAFDLLILDLTLIHTPGERILKKVRGKGITIPILIITAKQKIRDKETCFASGADDYLTKPFDPRELIFRLRALLKRSPPSQNVCIGELEFDLYTDRVRRAGEEINLTRRTRDLFKLLIKERGRLVDKQTIMDTVWSDAVVGDDVLRTYIKELRKILPRDSIETLKGQGYRLK